MKNTTLILATLAIFFSGCVSVSLGGPAAKRAEGVSYSAPSSPFTAEKDENTDALWRNSKNGNAISFISDCQDATDPSLDMVVQGVLNGIADLKYESNETASHQGREAKRVSASGKVDGVATKTDLFVFKRNKCLYILTYVAVSSSYATNKKQFDNFVSGFTAP